MSRSANDEQSAADPGWSHARNQLFSMIMEGRSFSGRERNCCFLNTGQERFATISSISGLDFPDDGRCLAVTDWDRDGDQDMWISNRNAPRLRFMRNDTPAKNHFLAIRLVGNGKTTNRDAIGARVVVAVQTAQLPNTATPPSKLIKTLRAGEGFLSQSSKWLHFGLGDANLIQRVIVHWPGGEAESFFGLQANGRYRLSQERGQVETVEVVGSAAAVRPQEAKLPVQSRAARVALETRVPMPSLRYSTSTGNVTTETFAAGKPTLVNLWASWCSPCVQELADFASNQPELAAAGLRVISLSVDQISKEPVAAKDVDALIRRLDYPFLWGHIDTAQMDMLQELNNQFFFLRRTLPLPSSFLVDAQGHLSVIYKGPVSVELLLQDIARSAGDYRVAASAAARLPGRSLNHERVRAVANRTEQLTRYRVASWLEAAGQHDDALWHFVRMTQSDPLWALPQRRLAKIHLDRNQLDAAAAHADRALKLDPKDADAHNTMGLVSSRLGDPVQAEAHFRESSRLDPKLAGPHNNLGIVLAMQGKIAAAGQCFHRAVQLDDQFAEAHTNLGNVYASRNNARRAIEHYRRAIEIDPNYIDSYNNLGTLFGRLGDIEQAIKYYRHATTIDPTNEDTRRNLERALQVWNSRPQQ